MSIKIVALFDIGADLNCIQEGLVPTKYFEKTKEGLRSANRSQLQINFKLSNVCLKNGSLKVNTSFLLVKNITSKIILGSLFIQQIMPFFCNEWKSGNRKPWRKNSLLVYEKTCFQWFEFNSNQRKTNKFSFWRNFFQKDWTKIG